MYLDLDNYRDNTPTALPTVVFNLLSGTEKTFYAARHNQAISRWAAMTSGTTSTRLEFSHSLVKSAENEWNIIENCTRGEGGFGSVRPSKSKIVLNKKTKKAEIYPTADVVKTQSLPANPAEKQKKIQDTYKEAEHQRNHYVNVKNVVVSESEIYIITEDCGISLDQLSFIDKPFDYCLQVALCILNEMMILEQKGVIHRDLKPQNICLKAIENSSEFKIIFIDFGLADEAAGKKNSERSGTPYYMAPELFEIYGQTTIASDIYALAGILGYVFGASDVLAYKKKQRDARAPFYFNDLGQRINFPPDIEKERLKEDIKKILNLMQKKDPNERPDLNFINRFFIAIPQRRELYKQHLAAHANMNTALRDLDLSYRNLGLLTSSAQEKSCFCLSFFKSLKKNPVEIAFLQQRAAIAEAIANLPAAKSHYEITQKLYEQEKSNSDYVNFNPFPDLGSLRAAIQQESQKLEKFKATFELTEKKINSGLFEGSNSSGILEIRKILSTKHPLFNKVALLQKIGREKTQKFGLSYWYSHSSVFGKGRHANVELLYQKLAGLEINASQRDNASTLDEINQFIQEGRSFTHG